MQINKMWSGQTNPPAGGEVWCEINLDAIKHNVAVVRSALLNDTGIIAVVKANAYGHGLVSVANAIEKDVDMFAVTSIDEALKLRAAGVISSILNLSYTAANITDEAIARKITVTIYDLDNAKLLHEQAAAIKRPLKVHIKIDTGMHRLGILPEDALKIVPQIIALPYFRVEGVFSHIADESDEAFLRAQVETMRNVLFQLQRAGHILPAVHIAKSGVLFKSNEYHFDAVRPGLALYGYGVEGKNLRSAISLKTVIAQMKTVQSGAKIGYMQTFTAPKTMRLAIVPIGYAHGYDRGISNKGYMLVDGVGCPVVGRVCMSQTIIDISAVKSRLTIGEEVVAIGQQKNQEVTVSQIAQWASTNAHEILARIPESVSRSYLNS